MMNIFRKCEHYNDVVLLLLSVHPHRYISVSYLFVLPLWYQHEIYQEIQITFNVSMTNFCATFQTALILYVPDLLPTCSQSKIGCSLSSPTTNRRVQTSGCNWRLCIIFLTGMSQVPPTCDCLAKQIFQVRRAAPNYLDSHPHGVFLMLWKVKCLKQMLRAIFTDYLESFMYGIVLCPAMYIIWVHTENNMIVPWIRKYIQQSVGIYGVSWMPITLFNTFLRSLQKMQTFR